MATTEPTVSVGKPTSAPARLDDVMIAMDVVDTLRHRDRLVERELSDEVNDQQMVERLRALYKSQGIDVSDGVIAEGVRALKESRFVYTPSPPGFKRTLATWWVRRGTYGKWAAGGVAALALIVAFYHFTVVRPREKAAEMARIEITETLPRQLAAAHQAVKTEARDPSVQQQADAILAQGQSALDRRNLADVRAAIAELDRIAAQLRREYLLHIPGRPPAT